VSNVRNIALAQPVKGLAELSNRGTGTIAGIEMTSTASSIFTDADKQLSPPLSIEFTSATTYDVLDVSNPLNPTHLVPPIRDQNFVPGITNTMLPADNSKTGVVSSGPDAGNVVRNAIDGTFANGYSAQTYVIVTTDPDTYAVDRQTFVSNANETAQSLADTLSLQTGVTATASNWAQIGSISSASPIVVTLNGVTLSGVDANSITDSINSSATLSASGITAKSDGSTITLESTTGVDFEIDVDGALATDSLVVTDRQGSTVTLVATGTAPANTPNVTIGGQVEVEMDEGVELFTTTAGVFQTNPTAVPLHLGFQLSLSGTPSTGDRFSISYNTGGSADNRNALALGAIQNKGILAGGALTIAQSNSLLVESIGSNTAEAKVNAEAATALLEQAKAVRDSVSGVNLDEEAAKLIEFEQGYNAAAQVINIARGLFDTLIGAVS